MWHNNPTNEEGDRVTSVPAPQTEGSTLKLQIINMKREKGLKHPEISMCSFDKDKVKITNDMKALFHDEIDFILMNN